MSLPAADLPVDGRQSPTALAVARGTARMLAGLGFTTLAELTRASGRRADGCFCGGESDDSLRRWFAIVFRFHDGHGSVGSVVPWSEVYGIAVAHRDTAGNFRVIGF